MWRNWKRDLYRTIITSSKPTASGACGGTPPRLSHQHQLALSLHASQHGLLEGQPALLLLQDRKGVFIHFALLHLIQLNSAATQRAPRPRPCRQGLRPRA